MRTLCQQSSVVTRITKLCTSTKLQNFTQQPNNKFKLEIHRNPFLGFPLFFLAFLFETVRKNCQKNFMMKHLIAAEFYRSPSDHKFYLQ